MTDRPTIPITHELRDEEVHQIRGDAPSQAQETSTQSITDLLVRAMEAEGPDFVLDGDIRTALGSTAEQWTNRTEADMWWATGPTNFTGSIEAALALVDRMTPSAGKKLTMWTGGDEGSTLWGVELGFYGDDKPGELVALEEASGASLPLAIVVVLLGNLQSRADRVLPDPPEQG